MKNLRRRIGVYFQPCIKQLLAMFHSCVFHHLHLFQCYFHKVFSPNFLLRELESGSKIDQNFNFRLKIANLPKDKKNAIFRCKWFISNRKLPFLINFRPRSGVSITIERPFPSFWLVRDFFEFLTNLWHTQKFCRQKNI